MSDARVVGEEIFDYDELVAALDQIWKELGQLDTAATAAGLSPDDMHPDGGRVFEFRHNVVAPVLRTVATKSNDTSTAVTEPELRRSESQTTRSARMDPPFAHISPSPADWPAFNPSAPKPRAVDRPEPTTVRSIAPTRRQQTQAGSLGKNFGPSVHPERESLGHGYDRVEAPIPALRQTSQAADPTTPARRDLLSGPATLGVGSPGALWSDAEFQSQAPRGNPPSPSIVQSAAPVGRAAEADVGPADGAAVSASPGQTLSPQGRLIVDNASLGRWIVDHLRREADRPTAGIAAFDPRMSRSWPGAFQAP